MKLRLVASQGQGNRFGWEWGSQSSELQRVDRRKLEGLQEYFNVVRNACCHPLAHRDDSLSSLRVQRNIKFIFTVSGLRSLELTRNTLYVTTWNKETCLSTNIQSSTWSSYKNHNTLLWLSFNVTCKCLKDTSTCRYHHAANIICINKFIIIMTSFFPTLIEFCNLHVKINITWETIHRLKDI